ncbi:MAG: ABC transporter substrate-binding protein, partial [Streptosporangiales bacterium]
MRTRRLAPAAAAVATMLLAGCGADTSDTGGSPGAGSAQGFPMTIDNCGHKVTLDHATHRVVLVTRNDVPLLKAVGGLDSVVAKAGQFSDGLYDAATNKALKAVPSIGGAETANGTVPISMESVLAHNPDAVFGVLVGSGINRGSLERADIPYVASPSQTDCSMNDPTFRSVYDQVRRYGKIMGHRKQAGAAVDRLRTRVADVKRKIAGGSGPSGTVAALYVPLGGRQVTVYGDDSMIDAQVEALGLTNVYGDRDFRLTKVSFEDVLNRDPDYVIVLTQGDLQQAKDAVRSLPGAEKLGAVREHHLAALTFDYSAPPTPFS